MKNYCNRNLAQTQLILIIVVGYHDYVKNVIVLRFKIAFQIVTLFLHYFFKIDDREYKNFCRMIIMLHYSSRKKLLTNLLRNKSELTFNIWQKAYQHRPNYYYHELDSLSASTTTSKIATLDVESKSENLNNRKKNVNLKNISKSLF